MEDMISRNDAYNTLTEYYHHTTEIQHKALREALERVPDSQPELIEREAYIRGFEQGKTQGRLDTLSAQPETHEERTETHACDLISRQAAIDAHYEYCNKHPDAGFPVWSLKILEDLPSVQPEIVRCKDCKHQVKEWRDDKRLKDKGYWVYGCKVISEICGYWAWLGQDDDFCSEAERRTDEHDDIFE